MVKSLVEFLYFGDYGPFRASTKAYATALGHTFIAHEAQDLELPSLEALAVTKLEQACEELYENGAEFARLAEFLYLNSGMLAHRQGITLRNVFEKVAKSHIVEIMRDSRHE